MPLNERKKIYWDSANWLSYINGVAERLPVLDALLAESASEKGTIIIYTSVISEVEVAFGAAEQNRHVLDPSIESQIDALWADREAIKLIEYHELIGLESRNIMRLSITQDWHLKPMDAIHLATAKGLNIAEFHTYDRALFKYSGYLGFVICEPHTLNPKLL